MCPTRTPAVCTAALLLGTLACEPPPLAPVDDLEPQFAAAAHIPNNESATYAWFNGGKVPGVPDPLDFGTPSAVAPSGDQIFLVGSGMLSLHPKSVSGGGTFEIVDSEGGPVGAGTWTATQLQTFHAYGQSQLPFFMPGTTAGRAVFDVRLDFDDGTSVDGKLMLDCALPDVKFPPSIIEGSRLQLEGQMNFNEVFQFTGGTLFVEQ